MESYFCFDIQKFRYRKKVASFDYDHTLVKPQKGTFSLHLNDWTWLRENVPIILKNLYKKNHAIVIFTNQSKDFKIEQIKLVLGTLNIPIRVYVGVSEQARKPNSFMWDIFSEKRNIDKSKSFFVGDALGRVGDWSDSDKVFSEAIGLKIHSPEETFPFEKKLVNPFVASNTQELVLMMGYPGSGKSTYVQHIPRNYTKLHGDDLKTDAKKKKALKQALSEKKSVVLDATHASKKKRSLFVSIAKEHDVKIRLVHVNTSFDESKSRNAQRETKVPLMALYLYRKHFEVPELCEGFQEIIVV